VWHNLNSLFIVTLQFRRVFRQRLTSFSPLKMSISNDDYDDDDDDELDFLVLGRKVEMTQANTFHRESYS